MNALLGIDKSKVDHTLFGCFTIRRSVAPWVPPPSPNSEINLLELLQYELTRAKRSKFHYIKCLNAADQLAFQKAMVKWAEEHIPDRRRQERFISQGTMTMKIWREVMKLVTPSVTYELWRQAYWGEREGDQEINRIPSTSHVFMEAYKGQGSAEKVTLLYEDGGINRILGMFLHPRECFNEAASQAFWEEISH